MKSIKKALRLLALVLIIGLATVLPVPITFHRKDNMPKFKTEQLDKQKVDVHKEDMKVIS
ncbi:hypothetical protein [uncultured Algibacter sp.]|uniref:hypothetical protein n=1 Tax=uncultured Algibacter sp. TaxID=298659 RepID=UPI0030EBEA90|tara:strand:- start:350 stop:529 length:180 start_codon:yes stop_codon:yes gene_type:complete